jgi:hypothetical protein
MGAPPVSTFVIVDVREDALVAAELLLDNPCDAAPKLRAKTQVA